MTTRPLTLHQVAERSDTLEDFGRHFQDWLHTVRTLTSRPRVEAAVREAPPRLARRFPQGPVADAWLAAYAEHTAHTIGRAVPGWTAGRVSPEPWFAVSAPDTPSRLAALRDSPAPFKSRNLFTPAVDLPLTLSARQDPGGTPPRQRRAPEKVPRSSPRRTAAIEKTRRVRVTRSAARARPRWSSVSTPTIFGPADTHRP